MALKKSKELVPVAKFTIFARIVELVMLIEIVLLFVTFFQTYMQLPSLIPVHYNLGGQPDAYGPKELLQIIPFALASVSLIIIAIAELRQKLVNKYPWVISLPAFYFILTNIPKKEKGYWVSKYFEALLVMGAVIGLAMQMIQLVLLNYAAGSDISILVAYPLVLIMFAVIEFLIVLRFFSKRMSAKAR